MIDGDIPMEQDGLLFRGASRDRATSLRHPLLRMDVFDVVFDLLALWDVLAFAVCGYVCAALLRPDAHVAGLFHVFGQDLGRTALVGSLLAPFLLRDKRLFDARMAITLGGAVSRTARRMAVFVAVLLTVGFLTRVFESVPRLWTLSWFASSFLAAIGGRLMVFGAFRSLMARGVVCDRIAVIGDGPVAHRLARQSPASGSGGVRVVATFGNLLSMDAASYDHALAQLLELGRRREIDRVVLALPGAEEERIFEIVYRLRALDVEVAHCSPIVFHTGGAVHTTRVGGMPAIVLTRRPHRSWGFVLKECEDRLVAFLAIVLIAPVLAAIALMVRIDSPGPVIFRQRRHGWNGSEFDVLKFRTMRWQTVSVARSGEVQTSRNDDRITSFGRFLRNTSLDELPQLFNVLNGTMSLVGPRPHPVVMRTEQRLGEEIIAEYSHRHRVKPGITGWAQINGYRGATETAEQVRKRVEHDIDYIENWSLLLDLKILALTPFKVVFQRTNAF